MSGRFCANCGAKLEQDTRFCMRCGYPVELFSAPSRRRGISAKGLLIAGISIVIVAGVGIGGYFVYQALTDGKRQPIEGTVSYGCTESPEEMKEYNVILNGDYTEYDYEYNTDRSDDKYGLTTFRQDDYGSFYWTYSINDDGVVDEIILDFYTASSGEIVNHDFYTVPGEDGNTYEIYGEDLYVPDTNISFGWGGTIARAMEFYNPEKDVCYVNRDAGLELQYNKDGSATLTTSGYTIHRASDGTEVWDYTSSESYEAQEESTYHDDEYDLDFTVTTRYNTDGGIKVEAYGYDSKGYLVEAYTCQDYYGTGDYSCEVVFYNYVGRTVQPAAYLSPANE